MKGWREGVARREDGGRDGGCGQRDGGKRGRRDGEAGGARDGRRGQERCWAQPRGHGHRHHPAPRSGASRGAQSPSLHPGTGERPRPHTGLGARVVAGPGGQSWPGGLGQLTRKEVTSRWPSTAVPGGATGPNSAPRAQGPGLGGRGCRGSGPAGARGSAGGSAEGKGSRRPPHISCGWSWRGCHWRVTGDTSESAQQQLRHPTGPMRKGTGLPRGPGVMEKGRAPEEQEPPGPGDRQTDNSTAPLQQKPRGLCTPS